MIEETGKDSYSECLFDERLLHLRLDDELSEYRRRFVDDHLGRCPNCESAFWGLANLKEKVAEAVNRGSAPVKLRERVIDALDNAYAAGGISGRVFLDRFFNDRVGLAGVITMAAAIVFFVFAARSRHFGGNSDPALDILHEYEEYRQEFPDDGVRTNNPHEAGEFFFRKLGQRVNVPGDFGPGIELTGACVLELGDGKSTCAIYAADSAQYMLFMVPGMCRSAGGTFAIACGEYLYRRGGHGKTKYISWHKDGSEYYLVGGCSHERLLMLAGQGR